MIRNIPKSEPETGKWAISDEMVANGEQLTCVAPSNGSMKTPCLTVENNRKLFCEVSYARLLQAELKVSYR